MSIEYIESSYDDERDVTSLRLGKAALTDDLTRQYLNEIGKTPLLTADEEVELSKRIEAGLFAAKLLERGDTSLASTEELEWLSQDGAAAKNHMLEANTRLVVSIARKRQRPGMPLLDLVQEGNIGLIRGVEKFDYTKGYKFSTYASWWIRQSITRGVADRGRMIRLPIHVVEDVNKVNSTRRELQEALGYDPSVEEIAVESELTQERVIDLLDIGREHVSFDTPIGDDGETTLGELLDDQVTISTEDVVVTGTEFEGLREVLGLLSERQQDVIAARYGLSGGKQESLADIGTRWGISAERVRQLEREALTALRQMTNGVDAFDEHRVAARRVVGPQDDAKIGRQPGARERERIKVAEQLSQYGWMLSNENATLLKAFTSNKSLMDAAESLDMTKAAFDRRLRMARQALKTVSRGD